MLLLRIQLFLDGILETFVLSSLFLFAYKHANNLLMNVSDCIHEAELLYPERE